MHCFFCNCLVDSTDFEQNHTRFDYSCPEFRGTFTFTHTGFSRFLCNRFVRENSRPHLSFAVDLAVDCNTGSFDVFSVEPNRFHCYESDVSEVDVIVAGCKTLFSSALNLAVNNSFRTKHLCYSFEDSAARAGRLDLPAGAFSDLAELSVSSAELSRSLRSRRGLRTSCPASSFCSWP